MLRQNRLDRNQPKILIRPQLQLPLVTIHRLAGEKILEGTFDAVAVEGTGIHVLTVFAEVEESDQCMVMVPLIEAVYVVVAGVKYMLVHCRAKDGICLAKGDHGSQCLEYDTLIGSEVFSLFSALVVEVTSVHPSGVMGFMSVIEIIVIVQGGDFITAVDQRDTCRCYEDAVDQVDAFQG